MDDLLQKTISDLVAHLDEISARLRQTEDEVKKMRSIEWNIRASVNRLTTTIEHRLSPEESAAA
jgi:hypothetical protein